MKRILSVLTGIAAVLSLAACRSTENDPADNSSSGTSGGASQSTVQSSSQNSSQSIQSIHQSAPSESSSAVTAPETSVSESQPEGSASIDPQPEETSKPKATYSIKRENGGVEILGGKDESTDVVVPSKVNDMDVVAIGGNSGKTMFPNARKITLPDSLREIDSYAFAGCGALTSINIPASVEDIGDYAFQNCSALKTITLSEGLRDIGTGAFAGCTSLTEISLPDSMQELEPNAFDTSVAFTVTYMGKRYTASNISELYLLLADD